MARYRRRGRVSGKFAASAIAAGAALAVLHGHVPPASGHTASTVRAGTAAPSPAAATAITYARQQIGKPYLWGGTGPGAFDCSGLTFMAGQAAGVNIGRTSQDQWAALPHITAGQLQPGDLVFYHGYLDPGETPPGHVTLYIGGGQMIEAYGTGVRVRITALRPGIWGYARP